MQLRSGTFQACALSRVADGSNAIQLPNICYDANIYVTLPESSALISECVHLTAILDKGSLFAN